MIGLISAVCSHAQHAVFVLPETGSKITITERSSPTPKYDRAGSINIKTDEGSFHFKLKSVAVQIPRDRQDQLRVGIWPKIEGLKLDSSRFFFKGKYSANNSSHTLLFFIGEGYASSAAPIFVVGFTEAGVPYKVLDLEEFDVTTFEPTPGLARIIGKASLSEVQACLDYDPTTSPYATTYDPFSVYLLTPGKQAIYSLAESRTYNLAHYVWAGPKMREDYSVVYNLPGHRKPFGATNRRALVLLPKCEGAAK